ncbi:MAG: MFS transporter, partial [Deltaproteobacteria bacterium]
RPEDMGLWPDGKRPNAEVNESKKGLQEKDIDNSFKVSEPLWTREEAIRTPVFWILTMFNCMVHFANAGVNFHTFPFMTDQGFLGTSAVLVLSIIAIFRALGSLVWGYLADRYRPNTLLAVGLVTSGLIFFLFFLAAGTGFMGGQDYEIIYILAALYGFSTGGMIPLFAVIWAGFFGRASLGSIYGFAGPFKWTANAMGPFFGALCFDILDSYTLTFLIFIIFFLLSGLIAFIIKPPKKVL